MRSSKSTEALAGRAEEEVEGLAGHCALLSKLLNLIEPQPFHLNSEGDEIYL